MGLAAVERGAMGDDGLLNVTAHDERTFSG